MEVRRHKDLGVLPWFTCVCLRVRVCVCVHVRARALRVCVCVHVRVRVSIATRPLDPYAPLSTPTHLSSAERLSLRQL